MKYRILLLIMNCSTLSHLSFAQEDVERFKNKLLNLNLPSCWKIKNDSNTIQFAMTDTMNLCQYDISPVRYFDTTSLNTYKLALTYESGWTKKRYKRSQKKNKELIDYLRARMIRYGDSLDWRVGKTNREWVQKNPMGYLRMVKNWTPSEKNMIAQVVRLPNDIIGEVGVFVWANTLCVVPERKDRLILELHSQLRELGIHPENFNWRNEKY